MQAAVSHPSQNRLFKTRQLLNAFRDNALLYFWRVMPRQTLSLLPRTSRSFGPPRRAETWEHYRRRPGVGWRSVYPARQEHLPLPFYCNDPKVPFAARASMRWPEFGVAEIPNGRLFDDDAWVVGQDDTFIGDFCYSGLEWHSPVNRVVKLKPLRRLPGRTLNLSTAFAAHNFFHYMIDGVSRWHLVRRAGYAWDDFDHVVLPRFSSGMTREIDAAIGVPSHKAVRMLHREHIECDVLIQPSFPGMAACAPWWVPEFYRELLPTSPQRRDRKVYLTRRGKRQPTNIDWIDQRLAASGFELLDPVKTPQFRDRLAEASHVVGVHGAGLANLVFCQPGTRVLEVLPTDIAYFHNFAYYYTICAGGGMPYGVVVGRSRKHRTASYKAQSFADFDVAPETFDAGLAALLTG